MTFKIILLIVHIIATGATVWVIVDAVTEYKQATTTKIKQLARSLMWSRIATLIWILAATVHIVSTLFKEQNHSKQLIIMNKQDILQAMLKRCVKMAKVYYVTGEYTWIEKYSKLSIDIIDAMNYSSNSLESAVENCYDRKIAALYDQLRELAEL